ncbi:hypothetical protein BAE44_0004037, partial [Dichanthelium oligosanthes]
LPRSTARSARSGRAHDAHNAALRPIERNGPYSTGRTPHNLDRHTIHTLTHSRHQRRAHIRRWVYSNICNRDGAVVATSCEVFVLDAFPDWRPAAGRPPLCTFFWNTTAAVFLDGALHFVCDETFEDLCGNPYCVWKLLDHEAGSWELLCRIDSTAWPEEMWQSCSFAPLYMYHPERSGRKPKVLFGTTNACSVLASEAAGGRSSRPQVLFSPDKGVMGRCWGCYFLRVGLLEESAVPVGRTSEEVVFSSPSANVWSEILRNLPARAVAQLNLVCRDMRAMIQTNRFARLDAANANINQSPRIKFMNNSLFRGDHYVCNPITGSYQQHTPSIMENGVVAGHIGLGYDPVAEKHMLVRLTYRENHSECKVQYIGYHSWCTAGSSPPRQVDDAAPPPVFANGKLCWMADSNKTEPKSPRCEIMAFDVVTASFEVLQGPLCGNLVDDDGGERVSIPERLERFSPEYLSLETTALDVEPKDGRILLSTGRVLGYYNTSTAAVETIYRLGPLPSGAGSGGYRFTPALWHESIVVTR